MIILRTQVLHFTVLNDLFFCL